MTKPRVAVLKLFNGKYLDEEGNHTNSLSKAAKLLVVDAHIFRDSFGRLGHGSPLWGMSIEEMRKRSPYQPLSALKFTVFVFRVRELHKLAEADSYDRIAAVYESQAKHAIEMSGKMKEKAEALRRQAAAEHPY